MSVRRAWLWAGLGLALLSLAGCQLGRDAAAAAGPTGANRLYNQVVNATGWVATPDGRASGWVLDRRRRLFLTNAHVVLDPSGRMRDVVGVIFPLYAPDGRLVTERHVYQQRSRELAIEGAVLCADLGRDLALVLLQRVPEHVGELKLAPAGAGPGDQVHLIGNRGRSPLLWEYVHGTVRQVGQHYCTYDSGQEVAAVCLETQLPSNPGDSGGPVVNDRGQLVGVNAASLRGDAGVNLAIDLSEVRAFLDRARQDFPDAVGLPPTG
jgi:S1-C subfamily serine protease